MHDTVRTIARTGGRGLVAALICAVAARAGALPERVPAAGYVEETSPAVSWKGSWSVNHLPANSAGGARLAMDAGAEASFVFRGPSVSWIGYRDEWCGIAKVFVDGVLEASVDTYATPARPQSTLYTASGLGGGTHTLTIRVEGAHGPASAGSWVWVDAFSVPRDAGDGDGATEVGEGPAPLPPPAGRTGWAQRASRTTARGRRGGGWTRVEQDDPAVSWTGSWSTNQLPAHSGGSARLSMEPSAQVSLDFTGTGVSWIGYRDEWSGVANVLLDGRLRASVDTYADPARPQARLFTIDGLAEGPHRLTIQPAARRRPGAGGEWVWVDAFSITR